MSIAETMRRAEAVTIAVSRRFPTSGVVGDVRNLKNKSKKWLRPLQGVLFDFVVFQIKWLKFPTESAWKPQWKSISSIFSIWCTSEGLRRDPPCASRSSLPNYSMRRGTVAYALSAIVAASHLASHTCLAADGACTPFLRSAMSAEHNTFNVYVAGEWRGSKSGKVLSIIAPHNETEIFKVQARFQPWPTRACPCKLICVLEQTCKSCQGILPGDELENRPPKGVLVKSVHAYRRTSRASSGGTEREESLRRN